MVLVYYMLGLLYLFKKKLKTHILTNHPSFLVLLSQCVAGSRSFDVLKEILAAIVQDIIITRVYY